MQHSKQQQKVHSDSVKTQDLHTNETEMNDCEQV